MSTHIDEDDMAEMEQELTKRLGDAFMNYMKPIQDKLIERQMYGQFLAASLMRLPLEQAEAEADRAMARYHARFPA